MCSYLHNITIISYITQYRRAYGKDRFNCIRYRLAMDLGCHSLTEFECCMELWC